MNLTTQQQRIFDFVVSFRADNGISPTLEEIAAHFGCTKVTVHGHVSMLISKGALTKDPNKSRSLMPNGSHLPSNEAWRGGVADVAEKLNALRETMQTVNPTFAGCVSKIRAELVALLARGGVS